MTESRLARIVDLFDTAAIEGRTAAEITDDILPFVPIGDAADWMRPGLMAWVRNAMKGRGLVQSPAAGGAYAQVVQLEFPELVDFVRHRRKQIRDDEASLRDYIQQWLDAHTGVAFTVDEVIAQAESDAA